MKKLFKVLSLGLLITLAGCSTDGGSTSEPSSEPPSSSEPAPQDSDGTVLKKIADEIFDNMGANRTNVTYSRVKRSFDPVEENYHGPEVLLPATYLYMTGVISEIEGVDLVNKAFEFVGEFEAKFGGETYKDETLGLTLNVKMDRTNNKVFFAGKEDLDIPAMSLSMHGIYVFVDISYNFTTKTLGDFKMYMDQMGSLYYFQVIDGVASKIGTSTTTEEIAAVQALYDGYVAEFDALCAAPTKVTASGATLRASEEAYVKTQQYADKLISNADSGIRIKESA